MNRIQTIAAIAMFAVVLGMSAIAPAMAKADTTICHYAEEEPVLIDTTGDGVPDTPLLEDTTGDGIPDTPVVEEAHWAFLTLNNNGATNGHLKNHGEDTTGDGEIDTPDFKVFDDASTLICTGLVG